MLSPLLTACKMNFMGNAGVGWISLKPLMALKPLGLPPKGVKTVAVATFNKSLIINKLHCWGGQLTSYKMPQLAF